MISYLLTCQKEFVTYGLHIAQELLEFGTFLRVHRVTTSLEHLGA